MKTLGILGKCSFILISLIIISCSANNDTSHQNSQFLTSTLQNQSDIGEARAQDIARTLAHGHGETNPSILLTEKMSYQQSVQNWPAEGCSQLYLPDTPVWIVEMGGTFNSGALQAPGSSNSIVPEKVLHVVILASNGQEIVTSLSLTQAALRAGPGSSCWDTAPTSPPAGPAGVSSPSNPASTPRPASSPQ